MGKSVNPNSNLFNRWQEVGGSHSNSKFEKNNPFNTVTVKLRFQTVII